MQRIVYIPLLIIALLSAIAVIVIKVRTPTCEGLNFAVPISGRVDENLSFVDSTKVKSFSRLWDFGDSSTATDSCPHHRYSHPGKYIVSLTINGTCREFQQIEIVPRPAMQIQLAQIQGPTSDVFVGEAVTLNEITPDGTDWEWTFGESGKVDAKTQKATYTFHSAGYKNVTVYVSTPSGKLSGTYTINIKNKDNDIKAQMMSPKDIAGAAKPTGEAKKKLFVTKLSAFLAQSDVSARNKLYSEMHELVCNPKIQVLWVTPILKKNKKLSFDDFCAEVIGDRETYVVSEQTVNFDMAKDKDCVTDIRLKMKSK